MKKSTIAAIAYSIAILALAADRCWGSEVPTAMITTAAAKRQVPRIMADFLRSKHERVVGVYCYSKGCLIYRENLK